MKEKKVNKNIIRNLLLAVAIMLFFIIINFSYYRIEDLSFLLGLKILSGFFLFLGIIILEIAYNKDNGIIAITAIELFVLSIHMLSMNHLVEISKIQFSSYILISAYLFSLYYILKAIIIAIKVKKEYLKSLSDIREIIDIKPIKKEAEKREERN